MKTFKKIAPYAALVLCVTLIIAVVVLISNNNKGKTSIPQATTLVGNNSTSEAPTPVPTEEPTTKKPDPIEIDLIAVGDVLTHMPVNNSYKVGDTWNYTGAFAHMTDLIKAADIAVVNQETILGGKELGISGYPNFNAPQELGDYLVAAGFNTVLHATNHTLDRNTTGVLNTINFWETKHPDVNVLGISNNPDTPICVADYKGIKVAMLNYTYSFNGYQLPADMPYLSNLIDIERITADVNEAKKVADFIIVFPHWGIEYTHTPVESQTTLAKQMADLGVDLVIGAHPHVIQPVEWVEGQNGHKMLVYYSLGNFISNQDAAPRVLGGMASVTIIKDENETKIKEYDIIPLVTHYENGGGHTVYTLDSYTEELAKRHRMNLLDSNFSFTYLKNTAKTVFAGLYE